MMSLNKGMQNIIKAKEEVSAWYKAWEKQLRFEGCGEGSQKEIERVEVDRWSKQESEREEGCRKVEDK